MADKRIIQLPNTPGVDTTTDEMVVDNATDGARRIPVGRAGGPAILDANGKIIDRLAYEGQASGVALLDAGGIPLTAANEPVVESGSNSNGDWIKYADGTMVCWHRLPVSWPDNADATSVTWTYPAVFASAPSYFFGASAGGNAAYLWLFGFYNETTSSVQVLLKALAAAPAASRIALVQASGRWK